MARPVQLTAWLVAGALLAATAARADGDAAPATPPDLSACATIVGQPTPAAAGVAAALLAKIDHNPLYLAAAPATGHARCKLLFQPSGAVQLEYAFKGSALTLRNDPQLEYTEQRLRVKSPLRVEPEALLADAEHYLYGEKGCRIDWAQGETLHPAKSSRATETVWHGDVCSCRATVEKNASGRVTGVSIKAAC